MIREADKDGESIGRRERTALSHRRWHGKRHDYYSEARADEIPLRSTTTSKSPALTGAVLASPSVQR